MLWENKSPHSPPVENSTTNICFATEAFGVKIRNPPTDYENWVPTKNQKNRATEGMSQLTPSVIVVAFFWEVI